MPPLASPAQSVFAQIVALSFSARQENECVTFLQKRSDSSDLITISDESQLRLAADGRLIETGYRFNLLGFFSVCRAISGGLSRVFGEVSGLTPSKLYALDACNVPAAVSIYNTALRVRFELLRERTLLVDNSTRSVDGFLGLNHKFLDNAIFLETILAAMREQQPSAIFQRAELVGRELRVYILDQDTRRTDVYTDPAHTYATGWYFCNREDSGNAVKALPCLFTKFGVAIDESGARKRVIHAGSDLIGRATDLIRSTYFKKIDLNIVRERVAALNGQPLGFEDGGPAFSETVKKWTNYLVRFGIPREMAAVIAKNAGVVGKDLEPRDPLDVFTKKVLAGRTGYDLVCSTLRYARNLPSNHREKVQSVGMALLLPKNSAK